jgi:hypothetical protein
MIRAALAVLALCACGGPAPSSPDGGADATPDLLARLRALPGVTADELVPSSAPTGYRYFALGLDQPVDHDDPTGAHFTQHLTLIVKDPSAPLVLLNTGYWNFQLDAPFELTLLLHGNQLVMEHRYFAASRPAPADWTKLTIAQAAADQHHVVETFKPLFTGPWLTTGQSKGGMTSIYHRRFYPDDVAGTVAYVAPISFGAPDDRYDAWVEDTLGTQACRDAVKAVATELLKNRRAMLVQRATAEMNASNGAIAYTRVSLGPAVESAVTELYWSFGLYFGTDSCARVPAPTASDDALWAMLEGSPGGGGPWGTGVSPVYMSSDADLALFEAYEYQAAWQLGYPGTSAAYLAGLTVYGAADYAGAEPVGVTAPTYDGGAAMNDVAAWVKTGAAHVIWVYGGWDPWTGGRFDPGGAQDALELTVPDANHGALLTQLVAADRDAAFAKLAAWTGVTPDPSAVPQLRRLGPIAPPVRVPPALLRLQRLRAP